MRYTITATKLTAVLELVNMEQPDVTADQLCGFICADWTEGDAHQDWLDTASPREIADWALSCHAAGEEW